MMEIPEAATLARQASAALVGKTIVSAEAGHSPHGFAFYVDSPDWYGPSLAGRKIDGAHAYAGYLELAVGPWRMAFHDGTRLRLIDKGMKRPSKHQFIAELDNDTALVCTIQMYGGIALFEDGEYDNPYYLSARRARSPLTGEFTPDHLFALAAEAKPTLSAKALLATEQRIPGLGNGCLQDVLFAAKIHPQRRVGTLDDADLSRLYEALCTTLTAMADAGGRDTEKDLFGQEGGYRTVLSAKTRGLPCQDCGGPITRKAYLGGNVYFCARCQPMG